MLTQPIRPDCYGITDFDLEMAALKAVISHITELRSS
jgi:hypothetical protein